MKALPSGIGDLEHFNFRKKSYQNVTCGGRECDYIKSPEIEMLPSGIPPRLVVQKGLVAIRICLQLWTVEHPSP